MLESIFLLSVGIRRWNIRDGMFSVWLKHGFGHGDIRIECVFHGMEVLGLERPQHEGGNTMAGKYYFGVI